MIKTKTAILIDGGFFGKTALHIWDSRNLDVIAKKLDELSQGRP